MEQLIGLKKNNSTAPNVGDAALVKDTTTEKFMVDVIEPSQQTPIIVDFWASWCGPCKQLGPILEKIVREAKGAVRLVKIDVDRNQSLAAQLQIQSIPTVYAFYKGQPVDGFMGNVPESQVRSFIENLKKMAGANKPAANDVDTLIIQATDLLNQQSFGAAVTLLNKAIQLSPFHPKVVHGLVKGYIGLQKMADADRLIGQIPADKQNDPYISSAKAALGLAKSIKDIPPTPELEAHLGKDSNNLQIHFDLAMAYYRDFRYQQAIENLLKIISKNRSWNDGMARQQLLKFFEALGASHPDTIEGRRKLSSVLFS